MPTQLPARRNWTAYGNAILFLIGASGAVWEIFHDRSQNPYVYALILALLRLGSNLLERVGDVLRR